MTSAIATRDDVLAEIFKPVQPDKLADLFAAYDRDLAGMGAISRALSQLDLVRHFMAANLDDCGRCLPSIERLAQLEPAIKALDAHYWQLALDLTDVLDSMPQARRAGLASNEVLPGWTLTWSERMPFPGTSIEVVMLVAEAPR